MTQRTVWAAVVVLLLATFLRFHLLEAQSFWNDEGNSARLSERSLPLIIEGTASDIHPPLYYLALRGWRVFAGSTEFGLRSFSALAGILTVAVTLALSRTLSSTRAAPVIVAGLLVAVSPAMVYYGQETRMYALLALVAVSSTWAWLNWLRAETGATADERSARWGWLIVYALLSAAGLYTHYFYPAVLLAQGILMTLVLLWSALWAPVLPSPVPSAGARRGRLGIAVTWAISLSVAGLLYAPWVPIFLRQVGGRSGLRDGLASYLAESGRWLGLGQTLEPGLAYWPMLAGALLIVIGLMAGRRRAILPAIMAAVPLGFSYLSGATDPAFFKFLLVVIPFLGILAGLAWLGRGWVVVIPAILTGVLLFGSGQSLANLYGNPLYARADYRSMAARIAADAHPNAGVILNAPNQWEVFTYYHDDGVPVYPLPRGQADPRVLEPELAAIGAAHDRLYALYWGESQRDPERVVERWLDAHTFAVSEEWVGDVRFVVYSVPPSNQVAVETVGARFTLPDGQLITLETAGLSGEEAAPGDVIQVQLVWRASTTPPRPYKVFLHLLDASGSLVAQRDSEPASGSRPTTSWRPDETVEDRHGLLIPTDLPVGRYDLVVGLYDANDPATRLPVMVAGESSDRFFLGSIDVR